MPAVYNRYPQKQKDPGASGTLKPLYAHTYFGLVSAAAESRTLARPAKVGLLVTVEFKTDGGDVTLTVTGGYDEVGSTGITFNDVNQFVTLVATEAGGTLAWRLLGGNAQGGGLGKVAVLAGTTTLTHAYNGWTLLLNSATEFATTLPTPVLGMQLSFVVAAAPSSASYTVVTAAAAEIIFGHVATGDMDAAADADSEATGGATTITFVDSKATVGDRVDLVSDGTNWYARGTSAAVDAITFTG